MTKSLTAKAITALLAIAIAIVLTLVTATAQTSPSLAVENGASVNVSSAQAVWAKTYGGAADDRAFCLLPVDGGFLAVGSSRSIITNTTVGWALRLDGDGNMLWNQTYLYHTSVGTEIRCAANLTDGYLLVGNVFQSTGDIDGYIAKTDLDGNVLWQRFVGGARTDKLFGGVLSDGSFYCYGLTYSYSEGTAVGWILRLDGDGTLMWNHIYGQGEDTALRSAVSAGNGCLVAGYQDPSGTGNYDFCLYKVTADGNVAWNQTYGGDQSEKAYSITVASDDGYILVGDLTSPETSTDALAIKIDTDGHVVWRQQFGGSQADSPSHVTVAQDGGYLLTGCTFSYGAGYRDFWLTKLTGTGEVVFSCTYGDNEYQEAYGVVEMGSNQYVMAGWTDPPNHPELTGKATYDWLILRIDAPATSSIFNSPLLASLLAVVAALAVAVMLLIIWQKRKNKKLGLQQLREKRLQSVDERLVVGPYCGCAELFLLIVTLWGSLVEGYEDFFIVCYHEAR
jgi:hypothetical protein